MGVEFYKNRRFCKVAYEILGTGVDSFTGNMGDCAEPGSLQAVSAEKGSFVLFLLYRTLCELAGGAGDGGGGGSVKVALFWYLIVIPKR